MKRLLWFAPLLLAACAVKKLDKKAPTPSRPAANAQVRTYAGLLPCPLDCKNIRTELTFFEPGHRFKMKEVVLGSAVGELTIESAGEWTILSGHTNDPKAVVYELTSEQFEQERYFLKVGDNAVRALNEQGKELKTSENTTLWRINTK